MSLSASVRTGASSLVVAGLAALCFACPSSSPPGLTDGGADGVVGDVPGDAATDTPPGPCTTNADCPGGQVCDAVARACLPCRTNAQCGDGYRCAAGACVTQQGCGAGTSCPEGLLCDSTVGVCVECVADGDCPAAQRCEERICVDRPTACGLAFVCPDGKVCDRTTNACVDCLKDGDCPEGLWCDEAAQSCLPAACVPGATDCLGNDVTTCRADGSGWDVGNACPDGTACKAGRCEAVVGKTCAEALQCMLSMNVTPAQAAATCGAQASGGSAKAFADLLACAEVVCGPIGGWNGYGCAVQQGFQDICQARYKACVTCVPSCAGKQCGDDGCGGSCGTCVGCGGTADPGACQGGTCMQPCCPSCGNRQCGPDGCGGLCGVCQDGQECNPLTGACGGVCQPACTDDATGEALACGPDGCGGLCGTCDPSQTCTGGRCVGSLSCSGAIECVLTCAGSGAAAQDCWQTCAPAGNSVQRERFVKVRDCAIQNCGAAYVSGQCLEQVLAGQCAAPWAACRQCAPNCLGRECGPDGCGGACGVCDDTSYCQGFQCVQVCVPACEGLECGGDGCGGSCGFCADGQYCEGGRCAGCVPTCFQADGQVRECGADGCGGSCGTCGYGESCVGGQCLGGCVPSCAGKQCGEDGCGGSCGSCLKGQSCVAGRCSGGCVPACSGKQCGSDGCGGSCGSCASDAYCAGTTCKVFRSCADMFGCWSECVATDQACIDRCWLDASPEAQRQYMDLTNCLVQACGSNGTDACYYGAYYGACRVPYAACLDCTTNCTGRQCGDDGCGGQCGTCAGGYSCTSGWCIASCTPQCMTADGWRLECGSDGCGGQCGTCPTGASCQNGQCIPSCTPSCGGRTCGADGCGGQCGYCWDGATCVNGRCQNQCVPQCFGMECGADGCGGQCGTCPPGLSCDANIGRCLPGGQQDGCTATNTGGCGGCACEAGVCSQDPYCCKTAWDDVCVETCRRSGGCQACTPSCVSSTGQKMQCGDDGCGGQCGQCPAGTACTSDGWCLATPQGASCAQILECAFACPGFEVACVQDCMAQGSAASQQVFTVFAQCVIQSCGMPPATDCVYQTLNVRCAGEYMSCRLDGSVVPM